MSKPLRPSTDRANELFPLISVPPTLPSKLASRSGPFSATNGLRALSEPSRSRELERRR